MKNYLILITSLFLLSCSPKKTKQIYSTLYGKNGIAYTNLDDDEMVKTIDSAKQTFKQFEAFFDDTIAYNYSIKVGIPYAYGKEQLWLNEISKKENKYFGRVSNNPVFVKNLKYNDYIEIPLHLISDWLVLKHDTLLAGGYTLRLLRNRLPKEERKIFDDQTQIKHYLIEE